MNFPSGLSSNIPNMESRKQAVMDQVRNELALANAQELINKINEKCFSKCITKPGNKLDSSEQTCVAKCMDRYMEAWNIVSRAYISRVQRESQGESL
ncbi:mitochondrial import inner membrane translocase subunit tim13 [Glomus cerebriforme]|uniref:Mitochondrial import inner membrane translocase subunit n=1 Tax=Glomus cerebriforme TaxID=658196 RepID=A0A397TL77_9GLOM|nr:mitochondrial import inner membrane translocase subunit tim13 [Glomus cerebriforme]